MFENTFGGQTPPEPAKGATCYFTNLTLEYAVLESRGKH